MHVCLLRRILSPVHLLQSKLLPHDLLHLLLVEKSHLGLVLFTTDSLLFQSLFLLLDLLFVLDPPKKGLVL